MRLIDADALIDELNSVIICENFDAERMIRDMPTVDVFDKIRAEIEQSFDGYLVVDKDKDYASNTFKGQSAITINHVFEIIDKYRRNKE